MNHLNFEFSMSSKTLTVCAKIYTVNLMIINLVLPCILKIWIEKLIKVFMKFPTGRRNIID